MKKINSKPEPVYINSREIMGTLFATLEMNKFEECPDFVICSIEKAEYYIIIPECKNTKTMKTYKINKKWSSYTPAMKRIEYISEQIIKYFRKNPQNITA